jgi:hypothetical protein
MSFNTNKHLGSGGGFNSSDGIGLPISSVATIKNSLLFDGTDEEMTTAQANIDTTPFTGVGVTWSAVFLYKVSNSSTSQDLFSLYDDTSNRLLRIQAASTGNRPRLYYYNSTGLTRQCIPNSGVNAADTWCHGVILIDPAGGGTEFYVNGTAEMGTNQITNLNYGYGTLGTSWRLGNGNSQWMAGNIAQMALVNRLVTTDEIGDLYNGGCPRLVSEVIEAGALEFNLEDNYTWNGSAIDGPNSMQSQNMEEADITTDVPC